MSKALIKQFIQSKLSEDGMLETGVEGVHMFRFSDPLRCAPAIYEPTVVAIVGGAKEAILDGQKYQYDDRQYLCCSMSMPVEAGIPKATPDDPLLGVSISLDTKVMTELAIEMESVTGAIHKPKNGPLPSGFALANWNDEFSGALLRLLKLAENSVDAAILGSARLRELYYAVLKGDAGHSAKRAFGVGNDIVRAIEYLTSNLDKPVNIENMALQVGMSRAVLHRKFKQATTMSPIQFVKSMRLNTAAMKIAGGMNVNTAAMQVGYVSTSQFSREFKRLYGQSPKQWISAQPVLEGMLD